MAESNTAPPDVLGGMVSALAAYEAGVRDGKQRMIDRYYACVHPSPCAPDQCILQGRCPNAEPRGADDA